MTSPPSDETQDSKNAPPQTRRSKKKYEKPELSDLGSLEKQTQAGRPGGAADLGSS
jgi:hypothetical protein